MNKFVVGQQVEIRRGGLIGKIGEILSIQKDVYQEIQYLVRFPGYHDNIEFYAEDLKKPGHGGARNGSGRKPTGKAKDTKVVRLDSEFAAKLNYLRGLDELIEQYRLESAQASKTSPRWEKLRLLLAEVDRLREIDSLVV